MKKSKYGPTPTPAELRFWQKVQKTQACWVWQGTTSRGYGNLRVGSTVDGTRTKVLAHRFSYELHYGQCPKELLVLHSCDNRRCVNPAHLRLGDHADNANDAKLRNRLARHDHRGRRNPNFKHGRYTRTPPGGGALAGAGAGAGAGESVAEGGP